MKTTTIIDPYQQIYYFSDGTPFKPLRGVRDISEVDDQIYYIISGINTFEAIPVYTKEQLDDRQNDKRCEQLSNDIKYLIKNKETLEAQVAEFISLQNESSGQEITELLLKINNIDNRLIILDQEKSKLTQLKLEQIDQDTKLFNTINNKILVLEQEIASIKILITQLKVSINLFSRKCSSIKNYMNAINAIIFQQDYSLAESHGFNELYFKNVNQLSILLIKPRIDLDEATAKIKYLSNNVNNLNNELNTKTIDANRLKISSSTLNSRLARTRIELSLLNSIETSDDITINHLSPISTLTTTSTTSTASHSDTASTSHYQSNSSPLFFHNQSIHKDITPIDTSGLQTDESFNNKEDEANFWVNIFSDEPKEEGAEKEDNEIRLYKRAKH